MGNYGKIIYGDNMLKKFKQWLCGRKRGHRYAKVWKRKIDGYIYECVYCGKPREEPPKGFR